MTPFFSSGSVTSLYPYLKFKKGLCILNQVMKVLKSGGVGSFSCLRARESEQRKEEEEDNITTVVKRSKRRVIRMCVGVGGG